MHDELPPPAPDAGWYDDPDAPGGKRYWDGSRWTDRRPDIKGRLSDWYKRSSRGVQWLVRVVVGAGGVAIAIGAILALVPPGPPPLGASLSQVSVGPTEMRLDDWAARVADGTASAPSGASASRLATNVLVQGGDETPNVGPTPPNGAQGQLDLTQFKAEDVKALNDGLDLALRNPAAPDVGSACLSGVTNPKCGLRSTANYLLKAHSPASAESVEQQFLTLFNDMRIPPDVGQPVGAQVDVNVSATGVSGHTVNIRWTLYRARGSDPVPEEWAKGQTVLTVEGDALETTSQPFWVPIPREEGPYVVRIEAFDEDDNRLDYADGTPKFGFGGAPVSEVDGIPFAQFTAAAFTVDAPLWTPSVIEQSPQGGAPNGGPSLTALVNTDETMMVQVQRAPEERLKKVADKAVTQREAEAATDITSEPTTIAGRDAYLLRYSRDEPTNPNLPELPDIGHVFSSVYLFNDSGSTWRVRAAVQTSVADGEELALALAKKMAETFEPPP